MNKRATLGQRTYSNVWLLSSPSNHLDRGFTNCPCWAYYIQRDFSVQVMRFLRELTDGVKRMKRD